MTFWEKIKGFLSNENTLLFAIVVLCSVCSFGLGRLSAMSEIDEPVEYIKASSSVARLVKTSTTGDKLSANVAQATVEPNTQEGQVTASKNGKNYYFESCSGAKRISEKNKITFSSAEEAEKAGYTISATCDAQ